MPGDEWRVEDIPADAGRAVKDYLATLDDAAFGAASDKRPKFISPADPAAQWTGALRGPALLASKDKRRSKQERRHVPIHNAD